MSCSAVQIVDDESHEGMPGTTRHKCIARHRLISQMVDKRHLLRFPGEHAGVRRKQLVERSQAFHIEICVDASVHPEHEVSHDICLLNRPPVPPVEIHVHVHIQCEESLDCLVRPEPVLPLWMKLGPRRSPVSGNLRDPSILPRLMDDGRNTVVPGSFLVWLTRKNTSVAVNRRTFTLFLLVYKI